jgi:hypothetical protein
MTRNIFARLGAMGNPSPGCGLGMASDHASCAAFYQIRTRKWGPRPAGAPLALCCLSPYLRTLDGISGDISDFLS